ncbi:MAG: hypothetical protein ACKVOW_02555 [Chitinophagaceae bacterium]
MIRKELLLAIVFFIGCKKETKFSPVYDVPENFQIYVKNFLQEASSRGYQYTIDNLIVKYDSSLAAATCGKVNVISSENNVQKIISLNPFLGCWENPQELEALIFHELGHCFLGREHDESKMPKGYPKSIMVAKDISLYSPCVYTFGDSSCDKRNRRSYYIDELFDSTTPLPAWGK